MSGPWMDTRGFHGVCGLPHASRLKLLVVGGEDF